MRPSLLNCENANAYMLILAREAEKHPEKDPLNNLENNIDGGAPAEEAIKDIFLHGGNDEIANPETIEDLIGEDKPTPDELLENHMNGGGIYDDNQQNKHSDNGEECKEEKQEKHPADCECEECKENKQVHPADCECEENKQVHPADCECEECKEKHPADCECEECKKSDEEHPEGCECEECKKSDEEHPEGCECEECKQKGGEEEYVPEDLDGMEEIDKDGDGDPLIEENKIDKANEEELSEAQLDEMTVEVPMMTGGSAHTARVNVIVLDNKFPWILKPKTKIPN